jgi:hypothetical protein
MKSFVKLNLLLSFILSFSNCGNTAYAAPKEPKFIIGNWAQPSTDAGMKKWKESGVNVWFGPEKTKPNSYNFGTQADIHKRLCDAGFLIVDTPDSPNDLARMIASDCVLWISLPDEPDLHTPPYNSQPDAHKAYVADWMSKYKWIADGSKGKKPLFINFAGPNFPGDPKVCPVLPAPGCYMGQNQAPYAALTGPGDILSLDLYPKSTNADRYPNIFIAGALSKMKAYFPGRRYMNFLEAAFANTSATGRILTPAEMEEQVKISIDQGVVGFAWFTHQFKGCGWDANLGAGSCWDARPADILAKTKEIAVRMTGVPLPSPTAAPTPDPTPTPIPTPIATPRLDLLEKKVQALEAVIQKLKSALQ